MKEHIDHLIETYLADGLTTDERAAFDAHLAQCPPCTALVARQRAADQHLMALFADAQPEAGFEETMAKHIQEKLMRGTQRLPKSMKRWGTAAAAVLVLGSTGALANYLVSRDALPAAVAQNSDDGQVAFIYPMKNGNAQEARWPIQDNLGVEDEKTSLAHYATLTQDGSSTKAMLAKTDQSLAVTRNAYRASYGWTFDYDRDWTADGKPGTTAMDDTVALANTDHRKSDGTELYTYWNGNWRGGNAEANLEKNGRNSAANELDAKTVLYSDQKDKEMRRLFTNGTTREVTQLDLTSNYIKRSPGLQAAKTDVTTNGDLLVYPERWPGQTASNWTSGAGRINVNSADGAVLSFVPAAADQKLSETNGPIDLAGSVNAQVLALDRAQKTADARADRMLRSSAGNAAAMDQQIAEASKALASLRGGTNGDAPDEPGTPAQTVTAGRYIAGDGVSSSSGLVTQTQEVEGYGMPTGKTRQSNDVRDLIVPAPVAQTTTPGADFTPATQPGQAPSPAGLGDLKVIRHGDIRLEVLSFLDASAAVTKAVTAQEGYIASSTSNQQPNGKVQGTITLRVKPERVEAILTALRAIGDVKNQQVVAEDVGKQYTDTESELRALSAMETRLLDLIKTGKGEVKDLVVAEQQLGEYRVRIEKLKGELDFFKGQIAMATLTVELIEKDIKAAASVTETENINANLETEEVEAGFAKIRDAVKEAKGRIVSGNVQTLAQDRIIANIVADVPPAGVDSVLAAIKAAGTQTLLEKTKAQTTPGGEDKTAGATLERKDTRITVGLSNLAAIPAKETFVLTLAVPDVNAAFKEIQATVKGTAPEVPGKASLNRILQADLQGQRPEQMTANVRAEVRASDAAGTLAAVQKMGEIMTSSTGMGPPNGTAAKTGFQINLVALQSVAARQNTSIGGVVDKVPDAVDKVQKAVAGLQNAATRITQSQVNQQDSRNVSATLEFDISKADVLTVEKAIGDAGIDVIARTNGKSTDLNNTLDSKVHYSLSVTSADMLLPRRSSTIVLEVEDVAAALAKIHDAAGAVHATESGVATKSDAGSTQARVQFDLPTDKAKTILQAIDGLKGKRKADDVSENRQVDTRYTHENITLILSTPTSLVPAENGFGTSFKNGFFGGLTNLLKAMQYVIMGVVIALPFLLVLWVAMKLFRRKAKV